MDQARLDTFEGTVWLTRNGMSVDTRVKEEHIGEFTVTTVLGVTEAWRNGRVVRSVRCFEAPSESEETNEL